MNPFRGHFSTPVLADVFLVGLAFMGLIAALVAVILVIRWRGLADERRRMRLVATWRPLMMESLIAPPASLPPLARRDWLAFVVLWNHLHESLRGDAKRSLNALAARTGLEAMTLAMLAHGSPRRRVLAALTLGHLGARAAWPALAPLVKSPNAALSLSAARALLQIDPEAALPLLMPEIRARLDWSQTRVATLLQEAGVHRVDALLAEAALAAAPAEAVRLLRYMDALGCPSTGRVVRHHLASGADAALAAASLQHVADPHDLPLIRALAAHPHWPVRVQAAAALGRLGLAEDQAALVALLADEQWWVRYRAAQALAAMPAAGPQALVALQAVPQATLVEEIVAHVLAEGRALA